MAIEAISNPKMTYQGSASAAEVTPVNAEKIVVNSSASSTGAEENAEENLQARMVGGDEAAAVTLGTDAMKKAVEEINKNAKNSEAIFGVHEATNRITIKIVDKDTKKVIREYPPEKTLDMIAKVWEMAGLMVDEKR